MAFEAGQTAIIVEVPAAEPAVRRWRERYDASAPYGVPAHVTVLVPFLHVDQVDEAVLDDLRAIFAGHPAFDLELRSFGRFPTVLYVEPEPAEPFQRLTAAVYARWPEYPPYRGEHGTEVIPHLTVAHDVGEEILAEARRDVASRLPVRTTVTDAWLLWCDGPRWLRHTRLPLAASDA